MMNLELLKNQKKAMNLTNEELAEKSGVSLGTINKIFSGAVTNPRIETLEAIQRALCISPVKYQYLNEDSGMVRHDNMAESLYGKKYTVDDYFALPEDRRMELIDGVFYNMTPSFIWHQRIVARMYREIDRYIQEKGGGSEVLFSPIAVQLDCDEYTIVEPDLIILCDDSKVRDRCIFGAPDWIMEAVSKSSSHKDYFIKARKYMEAGVKEYWIADYLKGKVTVYTKNDSDFDVAIHKMDEEIPIGIYPDLKIDMKKISPAKRGDNC